MVETQHRPDDMKATQTPPFSRPTQIVTTVENDFERSDINSKALITSLVVGTVVIALILFLLTEYFRVIREAKYEENILRPESTLLRDVRAKEDGVLHSYGVVDAGKKVYRMPVSVAMEKMAQEALAKKISMSANPSSK